MHHNVPRIGCKLNVPRRCTVQVSSGESGVPCKMVFKLGVKAARSDSTPIRTAGTSLIIALHSFAPERVKKMVNDHSNMPLELKNVRWCGVRGVAAGGGCILTPTPAGFDPPQQLFGFMNSLPASALAQTVGEDATTGDHSDTGEHGANTEAAGANGLDDQQPDGGQADTSTATAEPIPDSAAGTTTSDDAGVGEVSTEMPAPKTKGGLDAFFRTAIAVGMVAARRPKRVARVLPPSEEMLRLAEAIRKETEVQCAAPTATHGPK